MVPLSLLAVAASAEQAGFGLFNLFNAPLYVEVVLAVILLDLAIYVQHVATHKIHWLWRIHKVHHADREMDVSTAVRFHPIELLLSIAYKALIIALLGASKVAVVIFVALLFISPAFNHSNIRLSVRLDRVLRWVIATPDAHRIHHSVHRLEQDTNYGFFLIWWDRLFGTYTEKPRDGHTRMVIGLPRDRESEQTRLDQMLIAPFVQAKSEL
jgi:sterol desaturase/sphingolipid hydroxylase (fatty acid hydroxylase superfamily)